MEFSLGEFVEIADRVHVAVAEPASVNIGLVVGSTGALLIDTGSSAAQGRDLRAAVDHLVGDLPLTVAVTHPHYDHLLGLGAFDGVPSVGHAGLAAAWASGADARARAAGLSSDDVVFPTRTFTLATTIDLGDAQAEIVHFGRGHTAADAVVIVPQRGVVFAGDLLESAAKPSVGADSFLREWPRTLDGTLGTLRAETVIVPGHGPVMDRNDAFIQRAELAYLWAQAEQVYARGFTLEGAYAAAREWPWPEADVRRVLPTLYAQLEAAGTPITKSRTLPLAPR